MTEKTNKMATQPVKSLMLTMGIPMIISMALQALYNIVDSAFVSNMAEGGEDALNALTLVFPLQMLMVAIAVGTGVGVSAVISKALGANDKKAANNYAGNSIFLGFCIVVIFILFGIFGTGLYIDIQTTNETVATMAKQYLRICTIFCEGIVFFSIFEKLLQATGHSVHSTIGQISGAVVNIVLDPILIYGMLGSPELGITGAAIATVIGQFAGAFIDIYFHFTKNKDITITKETIKPNVTLIKEIYSIGLPAVIAQALMSIMTFSLNIIFYNISENMVTAYGLYYKIQQFVLFCAFGMRDAITPITSFAYGMNDKKRVNESIKYGVQYTTIIMVACLIILEIFANPFASIFGVSGETEELFISALRIVSISFIFAGLNIAYQGVFQALNGGTEVMIIACARQIVFILPIAYLFTMLVVNNGVTSSLVWTTLIIGEAITFAIAFFMLKKKKEKLQLTNL